MRSALGLLERTDDARRLGIEPVDPYGRRVVSQQGALEAFLRQDDEIAGPAETLQRLAALAGDLQP